MERANVTPSLLYSHRLSTHSVAQVFLRWLAPANTLDRLNVLQLDVEITLTGPGFTITETTKIKRQDQLNTANRVRSQDRINLLHTPRGSPDKYTLTVRPVCFGTCIQQTYTKQFFPTFKTTRLARALVYDFFFIKEAPIATTRKVRLRNLLAQGDEMMARMYPVSRVNRNEPNSG